MDTIYVHPIPLLTIADHHSRYDYTRVLGIILGRTTNGIHITNAFAIPFEESPDDFYIDTTYLHSMFNLIKRITLDEKILGWYHTGSYITKLDYEITRFIQTLTETSAIVLVSDLEADDTPIRAYTLKNDEFVYVNTVFQAEEAEDVGLEHLARDLKRKENKVLDGLNMYRESLNSILEYLDEVIENGGSNKIMDEIQECLNDIPRIELGDMSNIYLGCLVKNVLRLKDLNINKKDNQLRDRIVN